jgi:hypothetical protein
MPNDLPYSELAANSAKPLSTEYKVIKQDRSVVTVVPLRPPAAQLTEGQILQFTDELSGVVKRQTATNTYEVLLPLERPVVTGSLKRLSL